MEQVIKSLDITRENEVMKEFRNMAACNFCILRFLRVMEPTVYRKIWDDQFSKNCLSKEIIEDTHSKQPKETICVICLGLLQQFVSAKLISQVAAEVTKSDFESSSYSLFMSLPASLIAREHSARLHMSKMFPDVFKPLDVIDSDAADLTPIQLKTVWKWLCVPYLKTQVNPKSLWDSKGEVQVQLNFDYSKDECELKRLCQAQPHRKKLTRNSLEASLLRLTKEDFLKCYSSPPLESDEALYLSDISVSHVPIYLAGRYCKYSRSLSQTPWMVEGQRKGEVSIEELISEYVNKMFQCDSCIFSPSGREDVDVRMLGNGRPFFIEILNPKRSQPSAEKISLLEQAINCSTEKISVSKLKLISRDACGIIKQGEEMKTKQYCALCVADSDVTDELICKLNSTPQPILLKQLTPLRVLHRRSSACRERSVIKLRAVKSKLGNQYFKLFLTTAAGTYVKEFVHGDLGRTVPNVSSILVTPTRLLALDVLEVDLDWPPSS